MLKPGDEIIVPKSSFNIVKHHALYLGFDVYGTDWIIENNFNEGVRLLTAEQFFFINPKVNNIHKFTGSNDLRKKTVQNALLKIGTPYNLINYNCEHFTNDVLTGKVESRQVGVALAGLFALLLIGVLTSE